MTIRHVVFDIGNTLLLGIHERPYEPLIPDPVERKWFMTEVCSHAWGLEIDRGLTWEEGEAILIAQFPKYAEQIRAYKRLFNDMVIGEIPESVVLVHELLAANVDITGLTNWPADKWPDCQQRFPFLTRFRGTTVSSLIGLVKPDAAIYEHHAATFDLQPSATLFIDDNAKNVAGAKAVGWNAELFTDPQRLRADLKRYGLIA
jgi:2-haloacid dehalogenase